MVTLNQRHDTAKFNFTDYILPQKYYTTLLPALAAHPVDWVLGCEIKANLTDTRIELLADAGFTDVQPGIESFSSEILRLMDKGVSSARCVWLLRRGKELGVRILFNILYGFPSEPTEPYITMADALPTLRHLDPPVSTVPVQITRDAPMHIAPERWNLPKPRAALRYDIIFSKDWQKASGFRMDDYAYFFDRSFEATGHLAQAHRTINRMAIEWGSRFQDDAALIVEPSNGPETTITDTRDELEQTIMLDAYESSVLRALRSVTGLDALAKKWSSEGDDRFARALNKLRSYGLIFEDEGEAVALPMWTDDIRVRPTQSAKPAKRIPEEA